MTDLVNELRRLDALLPLVCHGSIDGDERKLESASVGIRVVVIGREVLPDTQPFRAESPVCCDRVRKPERVLIVPVHVSQQHKVQCRVNPVRLQKG